MLRRRIPQSGHLMTAKKFWLQTVPTKDCDVVLTFPADTPEQTVSWLQAHLNRIPQLTIVTRTVSLSQKRGKLSSCFAFQITASYNAFLQGLDDLHIPKPLRDDLGGGFKEFSFNEMSHYKEVEDPDKFLSSAERQCVLHYLLNCLRAEPGDCVGKVKFRDGESILPKCLSKKIISQIYPVHDLDTLKGLQKSWVQKLVGLQPLDSISEYFGLKIGLYFAWLGHYTTALTVPAAVGLLFWVLFRGRAEFFEDFGFVLFSFFNVVWASIYLTSWKRRSAELSYRWGTMDKEDELITEPRPLYQGEERISEITGKPEPYYPPWKRNCFRYFVTVPVIFISLCVVFFSVFLMLEFQQWMDKLIKEHNLVSVLRYLPKVVLAIVIPMLDGAYNKVAIWLNDQENYKTDVRYENHLIFKKTMFQFVNSFLALFYMAFYLQDMAKLKELLAALLITRQVIGNIKESIIPYATKQIKMAKMSFDLFGALSPTSPEEKALPSDYKKTDGDVQEEGGEGDEGDSAEGSNEEEKEKDDVDDGSGTRHISQVELEGSTPKYDGTFEDYLEMFIQFGYVTLFSSAYPLAGLCALLNNLIEIRSDAFKLCFIHQRPFPQRVANIGSWQTAMEVMGVIGIVVNCGLIGVLGPVHRIFPDITPVQQVILIIALEHLMLLLKLLLDAAIPDTPHWVAQERAKMEHRRRLVERKADAHLRSMSMTYSSMEMEDKVTQVDLAQGATNHSLQHTNRTDLQNMQYSTSSSALYNTSALDSSQFNDNQVYNSAQPSQGSVSDPKGFEESGETDYCPTEHYGDNNGIRQDPSYATNETGLSEKELFLATVSNMKPAQVFNRPHTRPGMAAGSFSPVNEDPPYNQKPDIKELRELLMQDDHIMSRTRSLMSRDRVAGQPSFRQQTLRQASDTDLFRRYRSESFSERQSNGSGDRLEQQGSGERLYEGSNCTLDDETVGRLDEELDNIVVNNVPTPPFPPASATRSTPTPPNKRVLEQKEFDKKLKAKRAIFSKGRSLSLASFRIPSRLKGEKSEKTPKKSKRKLSEENYEIQDQVRGELELLNIEQLININDLDDMKQ